MTDELELETDLEIEIDPVCGASVALDEATERALAIEFEGREYAFCGPACKARFEHMPLRYAVAGRAQP